MAQLRLYIFDEIPQALRQCLAAVSEQKAAVARIEILTLLSS